MLQNWVMFILNTSQYPRETGHAARLSETETLPLKLIYWRVIPIARITVFSRYREM